MCYLNQGHRKSKYNSNITHRLMLYSRDELGQLFLGIEPEPMFKRPFIPHFVLLQSYNFGGGLLRIMVKKTSNAFFVNILKSVIASLTQKRYLDHLYTLMLCCRDY